MISKKALSIFKKLCTFGYFIGAFPFVWTPTPNGQYVPTGSRLKYHHWTLVAVYCGFNSVFMMVRLGQAWCCMPGITVGRIFINFFSVATFTTTSLLHLNTAMYHDEFPQFINELVKLNDFLRQTLNSKEGSRVPESVPLSVKNDHTALHRLKFYVSKVVSVFRLHKVYNMASVVSNATFVNTAVNRMKGSIAGYVRVRGISVQPKGVTAPVDTIALERLLLHKLQARNHGRADKKDVIEIGTWIHAPEDSTVAFMHRIIVPIYLYSVSQFFIAYRTVAINPKYVYTLFSMDRVPKFVHALCAAFEFYISLTAASTMLVYLMIFVLYVRSARDSLAKLSQFNKTGHYHRIPRHYRALQLLNLMFCTIFRTIPMPAVFGSSLLIMVVSNYATLKLADEVKMPAALGFPVVSVGMMSIAHEGFPNSYRIYKNSFQLLRLMQHKAVSRRHHVWKFVASCKPLLILVGPYFSIKKETILTYVGIAFNATFQVLMI